MNMTALSLASTEEIVRELARRSDCLILGMILPTPESGSKGSFDQIFEFKESAPYQVRGFVETLDHEAADWHEDAVNGNDSAIPEDGF